MVAEAMGVAEERTGRARRFEWSDKHASVAHGAGSDMLHNSTTLGLHVLCWWRWWSRTWGRDTAERLTED